MGQKEGNNFSKYNFHPPKLIKMSIRDNSERRKSKKQPKTSSVKETAKNMILNDTKNYDKNIVWEEKFLNNPISCNQCQSMTNNSHSAMSIKWANTLMQNKQSSKVDFLNKTGEYNLMRRVNSSMSTLMPKTQHQNNISKSKKKNKKKSTHIKSQSNIPIYSKQISERPSEKKQYSGSKSKRK